jgi:crotonobetainyl-CoA:carnitine CoA-transferase CaiB-like acyl-CoA transferase
MKYKILDLSTLLPGPFAAHLLQEYNFQITKLEDMRNSDPLRQMWPTKEGISVAYQSINNNKNIIRIDFRKEEDIEKIRQLIGESDVVIENYKLGRMDKLGLGYEECKELNPKIIYCSVSGFGSNHPLSSLPAHDLNVLGYSGFLALQNAYRIPAIPFADIITSYEAAVQIVVALLEGVTKHITVSMMQSIIKASAFVTAPITHLNRDLEIDESILWGEYPCYTLYKTKDGKYMVLAAIERSFWGDFCNATGLNEIGNNQFVPSREIREQIGKVIATKTQQEWTTMNIDCFTPVLTYLESKSLGYV